jgi:hypothetical protein
MSEKDRNHIRIRMHTRIFVEVIAATEDAEGLLVKGDLVDVSQGGFQANLESEVIVGSILSVGAELPAVAEPLFMSAEVKWCRPNEDGKAGWLVGFKVLSSRGTDSESWRTLLQQV